MLDTLITNKTRIKLLLRFFLDPESSSYLRGLEEDFGESTNAIRIELNRFEAAGLLVTWEVKNKKMFAANKEHPLYEDIRSILRKHTGIDTIVDKIVKNLGSVHAAYVRGLVVTNQGQTPLEVTIFGEITDQEYLDALAVKASSLIHRPLVLNVLPAPQEPDFIKVNPGALLIYQSSNKPSE